MSFKVYICLLKRIYRVYQIVFNKEIFSKWISDLEMKKLVIQDEYDVDEVEGKCFSQNNVGNLEMSLGLGCVI